MFSFNSKYKRCSTTLFILLAAILLTPYPGFSKSVCEDIDINSISQHITIPKTTQIIQKNDLGSVCEVILRTTEALAPIYAGKDFILVGKLFRQGECVTKKTMEILQKLAEKEKEKRLRQKKIRDQYRVSFLKQHMDTLEELCFSTISPQKPAAETVYLITDPGCSHCKKALQELTKLVSEAGIEVKIIIHPILGEPSYQMALEAICKGYSHEDYLAMSSPASKPSDCKKGKDLIEKTRDFLKQADMESVPFIIGKKGLWVVDGNKMAQVRSHLNLPKN